MVMITKPSSVEDTHTGQVEEWEKEFDERFIAFDNPKIIDGFAYNQMKQFIHNIIQSTRDDAVREEREKVYQDIINALPETKDIVVSLMEKGLDSLATEK